MTRKNATRHVLLSRRGFTLVELLVVILIILLVSAVALPTVLPAINHRQVSEAARIVQGAIAGARDSAIHSGSPAGIRLLIDPVLNGINNVPTSPYYQQIDPTLPLAANRIIPLEPAPEYTEGMVSIIRDPDKDSPFNVAPSWPGPGGGVYPYPFATDVNNNRISVLMVEQCPIVTSGINAGLPNEPTSWFWNIRVGERITIGNSGWVYIVIGPMTVGPAQGNTELFVNDGPPGAAPLHPLYRNYLNPPTGQYTRHSVEYLFLVNAVDDDKDGFVDNGWDGVDNNLNVDNQGNPIIDELLEWTEGEKWVSALATLPLLNGEVMVADPKDTHGIFNQPYAITRRPVPSSRGREITLPSNVVIDLTTWGTTLERSRLPAQAFNQFTGTVDLLVYPGGGIVPTTVYSNPSSFGLAGSFLHFWLAERGDILAPNPNATAAPYLPIGSILSTLAATPYNGPQIKGEYRLVSVYSRTGQVTVSDNVFFDNPASPQAGPGNYNPSLPYLEVQQGLTGGH
jgi:prepilin-type N-terminal cleavage/methylation domain-containing protein